jgi:hypothetical protein
MPKTFHFLLTYLNLEGTERTSPHPTLADAIQTARAEFGSTGHWSPNEELDTWSPLWYPDDALLLVIDRVNGPYPDNKEA